MIPQCLHPFSPDPVHPVYHITPCRILEQHHLSPPERARERNDGNRISASSDQRAHALTVQGNAHAQDDALLRERVPFGNGDPPLPRCRDHKLSALPSPMHAGKGFTKCSAYSMPCSRRTF